MNSVRRAALDLATGWMSGLMARRDRVAGVDAFGVRHVPAAPARLAGPASGGPRVLLVDDNPSDSAYACDLLGCWGILPTLAADGAEAVALAGEGGSFDLILMDLQMPVLDGLEATKRIRFNEHRQRCVRAPVLAYTSCVLDEDVLRGCGVDGVLSKPCSALELQECLLRWCAPRHTASVGFDPSAQTWSRR